MQNQGDFKNCASSTDVVKRFAVIKSIVIKRVHCIILTPSEHLCRCIKTLGFAQRGVGEGERGCRGIQ